MEHPFARLPDRAKTRGLTILLVLGLVLTTFLMVLGEPLRTDAAPQGIVSFELAGSKETAAAILESWSPSVQRMAVLHLAIDYLYLAVYAPLFALACGWVAGRLRERAPRVARVGAPFAWGALLAGVLDALENAALLALLSSGPGPALAGLAQKAALGKFALVLVALVYCATGLAWSLLPTRGDRKETSR